MLDSSVCWFSLGNGPTQHSRCMTTALAIVVRPPARLGPYECVLRSPPPPFVGHKGRPARKRTRGNELYLRNLLRILVLGKFVSAPPRTPSLPGNELADRLPTAFKSASVSEHRPSYPKRNSPEISSKVARIPHAGVFRPAAGLTRVLHVIRGSVLLSGLISSTAGSDQAEVSAREGIKHR